MSGAIPGRNQWPSTSLIISPLSCTLHAETFEGAVLSHDVETIRSTIRCLKWLGIAAAHSKQPPREGGNAKPPLAILWTPNCKWALTERSVRRHAVSLLCHSIIGVEAGKDYIQLADCRAFYFSPLGVQLICVPLRRQKHFDIQNNYETSIPGFHWQLPC